MILTLSSEMHSPLQTCGKNVAPSPGVEIPASASQAYWNSPCGSAGKGAAREGEGELGREVYGEEGGGSVERWGWLLKGIALRGLLIDEGALEASGREGMVKCVGRWDGGRRESAR